MRSTGALGGACWAYQGIALLLGSPSTFSCLLPGVAEAGTGDWEGQWTLLGSGREAAGEGERDSGVRVLQLEANVNIRLR